MKINIIIIILAIDIFSLKCYNKKSINLNPEIPVLVISTDTVQLGEFQLVALQIKSDVLNQLHEQKKGETVIEEEEFWNGNIEGVRPFEKLKEETERKLVRIRIEQDLAKKYNIIKNFSYSDFIINLERENKQRLDAMKNKRPIYGPVQYSAEFYYAYLYNNMVIKLKDILGKEVFTFTEKEYEDFYGTNKDILFRKISKKDGLLVEIKILPGYKSLDDVKEQIRQRLIDEEYEKLIQEKTLSAEVREIDNIVHKYINFNNLISRF